MPTSEANAPSRAIWPKSWMLDTRTSWRIAWVSGATTFAAGFGGVVLSLKHSWGGAILMATCGTALWVWFAFAWGQARIVRKGGEFTRYSYPTGFQATAAMLGLAAVGFSAYELALAGYRKGDWAQVPLCSLCVGFAVGFAVIVFLSYLTVKRDS